MKLFALLLLVRYPLMPASAKAGGEDARFFSIIHNSRLPHAADALPKPLLDRLAFGVAFALQVGAAEEVSERDLNHAHVLFYGNPHARALDDADAVLLHTQEHAGYSWRFALRNILLPRAGEPKILDCMIGNNCRRLAATPEEWERFCTVDEVDLQMRSKIDVGFLNVSRIPEADLAGVRKNIRTVRGRKILFYVLLGTP